MLYDKENDTNVNQEESLNNEEVHEDIKEIPDEIIETKTEQEIIKSHKIDNLKYVNYLDSEILNIKSYTEDELMKFDDNKDFHKSFDEEVYKTNLLEINERQVVEGTVVAINEKGILVDIGFKSEGSIDRSEFKDLPSVGDVIETFIVCFEDRKGRLILSKEKANFEQKWMKLRNAFNDETVINGTINKRIKGGMVVDLGVIQAFLPGSQIDIKPVTDFDEYLGKEFEFKIVKLNELRKNVVLSRKEILASDQF